MNSSYKLFIFGTLCRVYVTLKICIKSAGFFLKIPVSWNLNLSIVWTSYRNMSNILKPLHIIQYKFLLEVCICVCTTKNQFSYFSDVQHRWPIDFHGSELCNLRHQFRNITSSSACKKVLRSSLCWSSWCEAIRLTNTSNAWRLISMNSALKRNFSALERLKLVLLYLKWFQHNLTKTSLITFYKD